VDIAPQRGRFARNLKYDREGAKAAKTDAKEYIILSFFFAFSFASSRLRGRLAFRNLANDRKPVCECLPAFPAQ